MNDCKDKEDGKACEVELKVEMECVHTTEFMDEKDENCKKMNDIWSDL